MSAPPYIPRMLDSVLPELLGDLPALLLTGPRATGKTTTAARHAHSVIRLDRPEEAAVARADADALLRSASSPTLIDEWQIVPSVLNAVKRAVDRDPAPGRFIITGSAHPSNLGELWPGTGRFVHLPMYGLTTRERLRQSMRPSLLDQIVEQGLEAVEQPCSPPDLLGYVREMLISGFPQPAIHLPPTRHRQWLSSYLGHVVTRDAAHADPGRDPARLSRYLETLAIHSAAVVDDATLFRGAGINRRTALAYDRLLTGLSVVAALPPWWSNRLKRLTQRPKRLLTDAALAAAAIGIDEAGVLRDGTVLGHLLETYVVAQMRAELPICRSEPKLFHLRTEQGRHEIDLIAELPGQRIVAFELKATSAPTKSDAKHLRWLRDELGERFVAGAVLHTGARRFMLGERIGALPIASLWGTAGTTERPEQTTSGTRHKDRP